MHEHEDERIRAAFHGLRSETEGSGRVSEFSAMMERARARSLAAPDLRLIAGEAREDLPRRRRVLRIGGWASLAIAAGVAAILLTQGRPNEDQEFEQAVAAFNAEFGTWRSPTSGLMNVPGIGLTRSVPSLGSSLRGLDRTRLPSGPDSEGRGS